MARGIAAVFDAIFLLVIAAIASSIVLSAAAKYGRNLDVQAHQLLLNYYAKQVIRVIVTSSVEREGGVPDYLLSYLKEALETLKGHLYFQVIEKFSEIVHRAMKPLSTGYDYVVILDIPSYNYMLAVYKVGENKGSEEFCKDVCDHTVEDLKKWLSNKLSEVYTSKATIFIRVCPGGVCHYSEAHIRVIIFPKGSAEWLS